MRQGDPQLITHTIEAAFRVQGDSIPVDHGYALYAALSRLPNAGAWLHRSEVVAIHPIRGQYVGNGLLKLTDRSRLILRLPAAELPHILPLVGKTIEIDSHSLSIGVPQTTLLRPAAVLYAHSVTTRNGQDEARFDAEIQRQIAALEVHAKPTRGKRKVIRIKDKTVVAHALLISELSADDSIHLQEAGLGGRRKMGCGLFIPWRG